MSSTYYEESYPPSLFAPVVTPSTGASAGNPGAWLPAGSQSPANVADLIAGIPNVITAFPNTAWVAGSYVHTRTAGVSGEATWNGTAWVAGRAAAAARGARNRPTVPQDESSEPDDPEAPPEPDEPSESDSDSDA